MTINPTTGADSLAARVHADHDAALRRFFARRGVSRHDVDDLIQEVYLRLLRQPGTDSIRCTRAFVFATATNLLRDIYRRRQVRGVHSGEEVDFADLPAEGEDPERSAEYSQHLHALQDLVSSLKPATRRVFLGHRLGGDSYAELSRTLGVSVSMIEKHMIAALAVLSPLVQESCR
jgi:RNA polymerase sigma-70 factor (ECF subfamily)